MNLGEAVTALGERTSVGTTDPWHDRLIARLNEALSEIAMWVAGDWPWLIFEVTDVTWPANQSSFALDTLAASLASPVTNAEISRIMDFAIVPTTTGASDAVPIPRINRRDLRLAGVDDGTWFGGNGVTGWTVDNDAIIVRPVQTESFTFHSRVVVAEPTLVADADTPLLPPRFHAVWLRAAASLVYEMKQDVAMATASRSQFERMAARMAASASPRGASGSRPSGPG